MNETENEALPGLHGDINLKPTPTAAVDSRYSQNALPEKPSVSLGETLGAARDAAWVLRDTTLFDKMFREDVENAPRVTEDHWESLDNQHDDDQLEALREKVDEEAPEIEWDDLIAEFATTNSARKVLSDQGWSGVGLEFGATILDPSFLVAAGASIAIGDKVSGVLLAGQKISRLGRLGRAFGEAVGTDAALMAARSQTTSDYSERDMMVDMLATLVVVGGLEGAMALKASHAVKALEKKAATELIEEVESTGLRHAGAAETKGVDKPAGRFRMDDYGVMANSKNSVVQEFSEKALQDGIGGGSQSAAVLAQRMREHHVGRHNTEFLELWKEHKKTVKGGVVKQAQEMNKLSEQVWEAVVLGTDHGPNVSRAAAAISKQNKELLEEAQASGLNGFKDVPHYEGYMKQEWDTHAWRKATLGTDGLKEDDLVELLHRGLDVDDIPLAEQLDQAKLNLREHTSSGRVVRDGADDTQMKVLRDEVSDIEQFIAARKRLAMGFVRRMMNRSDGEMRPLNELLEDEDSLVKWLREDEEFRSSTEAEIKSFVSKALNTRVNQDVKNVVNRAKRRIHVDPKAEFTKGTRTVRVADLMNRDSLGLQQSYIHEMSGNIAFAKRMDIKGPQDWIELKDQARTKEIELRASEPGAEAKADKVEEQLEEMKREIFGHNRYDLSGTGNRAASVLMKYNFTLAMGKAAFSALSEMGRIAAENRVRNVLKVLPSLHKVIKDSFRNTTTDSSLVKEVNSFNASIGDEHLMRYFNSFDETGVKEGQFTDGMLNKTELYAHRGARLMAKASLLAPMDKALRLVSFQSSMNSLYSHLMKGKDTRLAFDEMGMDKALRARIKSNMKKHGVETDRFGNVTKLNIEAWDRKTADDMMDALTVNGARQVQKAIAGENVKMTSHPIGRVFLQFRKFALDSYTKHLRADIRSAKNGEALRVMLSNMYAAIFATLGYTARTHSGTVGMDADDRRDYLEERLAPERLAANIAAYTPSVGPIVTLWNAVPGTMFPEAVIPVTRSTGLQNRGLLQNPSANTANKAASLFHDVGESKKENIVDRGRYLMPLQNTIWGDALLNSMSTAIKN